MNARLNRSCLNDFNYEVFAKCPETGREVPTGAIFDKDEFEKRDKLYGMYICFECKKPHLWRKHGEGTLLSLVAK